MNNANEHDFVIPNEGETPDRILLDLDSWKGLASNPQYIAKKKADRISYHWDKLIEHFTESLGVNDAGERDIHISEVEWGLRILAAEPRIRRRQLAEGIFELIDKTQPRTTAVRVMYSNDFPDKAYIFLILPFISGEDYLEYRKKRKDILRAYCQVAKLKCIKANYIIGIATELIAEHGASEDFAVLDVSKWGADEIAAVLKLQKELKILLPENIKIKEGRTQEWPQPSRPSPGK